MKKYKINKSVSLKSVELETKTCFISNKRNQMFLSLVSSGWSMRIILLGLCLRVTVNKNPLNLEKTILIKGSTKDPLI